MLNQTLLLGDAGYNIQRSLRFRSSASAYLNRTPSAGNQKTFTWSGWVKRGKLGALQEIFTAGPDGNNCATLAFNASDQLLIESYVASYQFRLYTTAVYRDPSAWYHIVMAMDTTQATDTNRMKLYVNGQQITATSILQYPTQNLNTYFNAAAAHLIGNLSGFSAYFDGYLTEVNFIDGQALTPSSFGQTDPVTGVWQPKKYAGTYGTNGFYLPFTDNTSATTLAYDKSGNGNNWTANNISTTAGATYDSMTDVPTLTSPTAANFAVLNPLQSAVAPTAGNLEFASGAGEVCPKGTIQLPLTGKWYWETYCSATGTDNYIGVTTNQTGTSFTGTYRAYRKTGNKETNGTGSAYGASWASGDTLGVAVDMDAGTITFYKNGTSQGVAFSDLAGTAWTVFFYGYVNGGHQVNFGQRPFSYTPPTGFVALNTFNLPDATIKAGNKYFDATTYTGNGSTQTITNAGGFQPDLVWIKTRSTANDHRLTDAIRGTTKELYSNQTYAEGTDANGLTAFNTNGFSVGSSAAYNGNTVTVVAWQWNAGGSTVTNTSGTISSQVRANPTAGFSVVTYTGTGANATVGHGLGVAPKMMIVKCRNAAGLDWYVYHQSANASPASGLLFLNTTDPFSSASTVWNNTAPTSSVFSLGTAGGGNASGNTYVAYCFSEVAGYSKFGSYTGNGSADGTFVYTGFRPRYVMYKRTDTTANWGIWDTVRSTYNVMNLNLYPNLNVAESVDTPTIDALSNGFKLRSTASASNANGGTYIFMAFAENPLKYSLAR